MIKFYFSLGYRGPFKIRPSRSSLPPFLWVISDFVFLTGQEFFSPQWLHSLLIVEASRTHSLRQAHTREGPSGRGIGPSQRPPPTTYNTHNRHPCPQGDSNPQSQQVSGRRPRGHWDFTGQNTGV